MKDKEIKLEWYCGNYVGPAYWHQGSDWYYEPGECGCEFETFYSKEDFMELIIWEKCPDCGAELNLDDDEPMTYRLVEGEYIPFKYTMDSNYERLIIDEDS